MNSDDGNGSFHWDGSPKDDTSQPTRGGRRTMRLHPSSASKSLRADKAKRCKYCNHQVEWYERFDGGVVPLIPIEFRTADIPERCRWSVANGLAYIGDGARVTCRVAHPTVCPGVEHDDNDPDLEEARLKHRIWTRKWIDEGVFVPAVRGAEEDVVEQKVKAVEGEARHIVVYAYQRWLAPTSIDKIRCVAHAHRTRERCNNMVWDTELNEGYWEQIDIPVPQGRQGRQTLWTGQKMWVYALHSLDTSPYKRWLDQRCAAHHPASPAHNSVDPEWVRFDTWRHAEFIAHDLPEMPQDLRRLEHPLLSKLGKVPDRIICAAAGCTNGTVTDEAPGWMCWKCKREARRRSHVHRRWQTT
ncbi:DUF6083 domain-containing protein [Streptomyces sp. NPDC048629]|uniref:DUF6083 domain-containing protein n=1 Tax=Streptomyces sp. NPDC048629 TaxID=3154824 RepID=UPI003428045C